MAQLHVRESIQELDAHTWIIGNRIILGQAQQPSPGCWSDDQGTSFFTASEAPEDLAHPEGSGSHPFPLVYDAGNAHAVWKIGHAYLKVMLTVSPDTTREHVTLAALQNLPTVVNFVFPRVLFHGEWDGRYYLITTQVPGERLNEAWPSMDEATKTKYVAKVANVCADLVKMESGDGMISGVDGRQLPEYYLLQTESVPFDFSLAAMSRARQELGLDGNKTVFYHCDLGPTNVLVDLANDTIGIIDWECVGFVPIEWVRTKFRVCRGMDLENDETERNPAVSTEWRARVQKMLGDMGFVDCVGAWVKWKGFG